MSGTVTLLIAPSVTDLPLLVVQGVTLMTAGTKPSLVAAGLQCTPTGQVPIVLWLPLTCFPLYVLPS